MSIPLPKTRLVAWLTAYELRRNWGVDQAIITSWDSDARVRKLQPAQYKEPTRYYRDDVTGKLDDIGWHIPFKVFVPFVTVAFTLEDVTLSASATAV